MFSAFWPWISAEFGKIAWGSVSAFLSKGFSLSFSFVHRDSANIPKVFDKIIVNWFENKKNINVLNSISSKKARWTHYSLLFVFIWRNILIGWRIIHYQLFVFFLKRWENSTKRKQKKKIGNLWRLFISFCFDCCSNIASVVVVIFTSFIDANAHIHKIFHLFGFHCWRNHLIECWLFWRRKSSDILTVACVLRWKLWDWCVVMECFWNLVLLHEGVNRLLRNKISVPAHIVDGLIVISINSHFIQHFLLVIVEEIEEFNNVWIHFIVLAWLNHFIQHCDVCLQRWSWRIWIPAGRALWGWIWWCLAVAAVDWRLLTIIHTAVSIRTIRLAFLWASSSFFGVSDFNTLQTQAFASCARPLKSTTCVSLLAFYESEKKKNVRIIEAIWKKEKMDFHPSRLLWLFSFHLDTQDQSFQYPGNWIDCLFACLALWFLVYCHWKQEQNLLFVVQLFWIHYL